MAKKTILNTHTSLLPWGRGPAPIQRSIIESRPLGVSIINVHPKIFDAGDIYSQEEFNSRALLSFSEISELADLGANLCHRVLVNFDNIRPQPQDEKQK